MDPSRHPAGTPTGGRFAPDPHAEADVHLGVDDQTTSLADELTERGIDLDSAIRDLQAARADRLPEWPGLTDGGDCPGQVGDEPCSAGSAGIVYTDSTERWWRAADLDDASTPSFDGDFDWDDQGAGDNICCVACDSQWKPPPNVDWG